DRPPNDVPRLRWRQFVGDCKSFLSSPEKWAEHAARMGWDEMALFGCAPKVMGLPGKPNGISGADVDRYYREGRIREIADYCESDVLNTYRVWLRYELFRGGLPYEVFRKSEDNLTQFINMRGNTKPHLTELIVRT